MILRSGTLCGVTSIAASAHAVVDLLSAVLASDDPDLSVAFDALSDALHVAVPSFIGFTVHADQFSLSWGPGMPARSGDPVGASSTLRWEPTSTANTPLSLVMYAASAGAWVDLGADLGWLTHNPPQSFIFDRDLVATMTSDGTGLARASIVNQAIGALIERGVPPEEATAHLMDRAHATDTDLATAAATVLAASSR